MVSTIYKIRIHHPGLDKYREIKGADKAGVEEKARAQLAAWNKEWVHQAQKQFQLATKEGKKAWAAKTTEIATSAIKECEEILSVSLRRDNAIDFEELKPKQGFQITEPQRPEFEEIPVEPIRSDREFMPRLNLLDKFSASRRQIKRADMDGLFSMRHTNWAADCARLQNRNKALQRQYQSELDGWTAAKSAFDAASAEGTASIDLLRDAYMKRDEFAIKEYPD